MMRQGWFFGLFGEIYVKRGGDFSFFFKIPDEV